MVGKVTLKARDKEPCPGCGKVGGKHSRLDCPWLLDEVKSMTRRLRDGHTGRATR